MAKVLPVIRASLTIIYFQSSWKRQYSDIIFRLHSLDKSLGGGGIEVGCVGFFTI